MFKKLKDKLAEEVKSSPQRIQQFAQAAQAAVTSASSSISDITNSDLFSIADTDSQQSLSQASVSSKQTTFQDVPLVQPLQSTSDTMDYSIPTPDLLENQRQRRLSNSSFASDVSFRLPSYETPSMYHLQSDMEVSASEAEERGFSSGTVSLDRVTKEQLYAAYRRTQERYTKYRTQYGDLARHYKLLERENVKARSVLVETQDKALRRISELREQCSLEQSAKAHLEKALRVEIEEQNMKIEALNTKVKLLQSCSDVNSHHEKDENLSKTSEQDNDVQLINLSIDNEIKQTNDAAAEILALNKKIEKMEQLLNKYKDSLKLSKEKNSQLNMELQTLSNDLDGKKKEIEDTKITIAEHAITKQKIEELGNLNEELQNKINVHEFTKTREQSTLEVDYQKSQEEITKLLGKIDVFSKREEDYAISLAENKLSIHKELESKETEIRSLKNSLDDSKKEIQSLNIVVNDYKKNLSSLESERSKLMHDNNELTLCKPKIKSLEMQIEDISKKCHNLEQSLTKSEESYKCLQLQMKQETAEKLAMIDRNVYLENRNTQLCEDNNKKSTQVSGLENELQNKEKAINELATDDIKKDELLEELNDWKDKYAKLESEIQEERDELIKLQSEIEKLLANHELLQSQNIDFRQIVSDLKSENVSLKEKSLKANNIKSQCLRLSNELKELKNLSKLASREAESFKLINIQDLSMVVKEINCTLIDAVHKDSNQNFNIKLKNDTLQQELQSLTLKYDILTQEFHLLQENNIKLKATVGDLEAEKTTLQEQIKYINKQYEDSINELAGLRKEYELNTHKIKELRNQVQNLEPALEFEKKQHTDATTKIEMLNTENQNLVNNVQKIEAESNVTSEALDELRNQYKSCLRELDTIKTENAELLKVITIKDDKITDIEIIKQENKSLALENIHLKGQVEHVTESYNDLDTEINDLRNSHAEIVLEKDRLSEIIEKLESRSRPSTLDNDTQTDEIPKPVTELITSYVETSETQDVINDILVHLEESKSQSNTDDNELSNQYLSIKTEYDLLKDENRRFKSDIDGLQTYLTKISKENSILNDKLREMIATGEHSTESTVLAELQELNIELQSSKDKNDDLLRENTLLNEENLELKDQLKSQNFAHTDTSSASNKGETSLINEKYNNLLLANNALEKRLKDLEQINQSFNGDMTQVQEKNDRLRLSNEKLERRLDEALVSLRHLHALQENTELEYLRNILYEYLTGTGLHSVTLAKVLSAIVKFDDMQTKLVLQKEKERQGFLRQLGII